jgi:hypothetical protein
VILGVLLPKLRQFGYDAKEQDEKQNVIINGILARLELLEQSSLTANKYRLLSLFRLLEKALDDGKVPCIADVLVMEETYKIYCGQGGNGEIKHRYEELKNKLEKE